MPLSASVQRLALLALLPAIVIAVFLLAFAGSSSVTEAHAGQFAFFGGPGSGYINVANSPGLNPTSAITVEAWVYLTSESSNWGGNTSCPTIIGKGYSTAYWLGVCNGFIRFYARNGNSFTGPGTIPLDTWTHIAATYDGTTTITYINGVLDGTTTSISGAVGTNSQDLRIGDDTDYDATPMGAIDEVRLWSVARTQPEIAGSMNTPITGATAGLIGVWNMEGNGNDDSGVGYDGNAVGDIAFHSGDVPTAVPSGTPVPTDTPVLTDTASPTPTPTLAPGGFRKGDVNCDGNIDEKDMLVYLEYNAQLVSRPTSICPAVPISAPQGVPSGPFGHFLDFSAPDAGYVSVPDSPGLNPTDAITVEAWVYLSSYTAQNGVSSCQSLVGKGYTTSFWLGVCNGHVRFYPHGGDYSRDSTATVPLRRWTHIAAVAALTSVTFYINGTLDSQNTDLTGAYGMNTNPVEIGSDADYNVRPFGGIDEVQIWNIARSQSDIASTMSSPVTAPQTGLVAAYHFDDDLSEANGLYNGSAVGIVTVTDVTPQTDWADLDCDGYVNSVGDELAELYYAAGLTWPLPSSCEALGTPES